MSTKTPKAGRNIQVTLTAAQDAFLSAYGDGSAPAGIRRLVSAAMAEQHHDPLIALGGLIGRAAAMYALAAKRHDTAPAPTLAGSTAAPGQQQQPPMVAAQVSPTAALTQQPAATTELTGFEGWDE